MHLDHTHDPAALSWVDSANTADTDFPLQNLPYGLFRRAGRNESLRAGVAIGDAILDLKLAEAAGRWTSAVRASLQALAAGDMNRFMAASPDARRAVRRALFDALKSWRRDQAAEQGAPPYVIFHDRTLQEIAAVRPSSLDALARVGGVGASKLERYGEAVLRVVRMA